MKNRSFLVQFEHLKIQEAKFNSLAASYFSCTISRFMNFLLCSPQLSYVDLRAVHKFQPTFLKSVQRTGNET